MRADRGYWCLPEVDLGLPLTVPMKEVVTVRLPRAAAHDAIMTGRRYTAEQAHAIGIVEHVEAEERRAGSCDRTGWRHGAQGPFGDRRAQAHAVRSDRADLRSGSRRDEVAVVRTRWLLGGAVYVGVAAVAVAVAAWPAVVAALLVAGVLFVIAVRSAPSPTP